MTPFNAACWVVRKAWWAVRFVFWLTFPFVVIGGGIMAYTIHLDRLQERHESRISECVEHAAFADLAILRNGFSIRHERREVIRQVTRLYMGADKNSYVDIPTVEIDHFENDPQPKPGFDAVSAMKTCEATTK